MHIAAVGLLLLCSSVALNLVLARRVRSFQQFQSTKAADRRLQVGAIVPPIAARLLNGQQQVISYVGTNQPTVLYVFTPPCSWCSRNVNNFKTLVDKARVQYRFIGLSLSEKTLAEYVAKNELKLPVYSGLSRETLTTYKLGSTPQTLVISPEGKVLQDWVGAYVGEQKSQVEAFFHVSLPGSSTRERKESSELKRP
jgi:peroxiredoxin